MKQHFVRALISSLFIFFSVGLYGQWTQVGSDIDGEAAFDQSGIWTSISGNGNRVAIGAQTNDGNGSNSGHARVYEDQAGVWVQIGSDIDGEAVDDGSGRSVSISDNGLRVAIGANGNDGNGSNAGHVRVYEDQAGGMDSNWERY